MSPQFEEKRGLSFRCLCAMVFYFEASSNDIVIYMGKDKFENEELIAYGWPEDVWFHVDDLSSAHVYLRLPRGPLRAKYRETGNLDHIPDALKECCALVKANSIEGSKRHDVDVIYTPWENLDKRADMATGQIGYRDQSKVVKVRGVTRERELVKRLEKTKTESYPDLFAARQARDERVRHNQKERQKAMRKQQAQQAEEKRIQAENRSYDRLFEKQQQKKTVEATVDDTAAVEAEEDFM